MAITDALKRAPKWAWVTAAGVGIGAGAITLYRGRASEDTTTPPEDGGNTPVGGSTQVGTAPPAVVVPPIVTGTSGDQGSAVAGMATWADAVGDLMGNYASIVSQSVGGVTDIALANQDILGQLALAGGAPGKAVSNPTPIVVVAPSGQTAPKPVPTSGNRVVKRCRRSYNGKSNNCRVEVTDVYASGKRRVVSDTKVSDKPCGNPHTECHRV